MAFLTFIFNLVTHPYAVPLWGALSAILLKLFDAWKERRRQKLEERKVDVEDRKVEVSESLGERQQNREDFQVITDALRKELDRVSANQDETNRQLEKANEETEKCEARYFELVVQHRELLRYCATLAKEVRELREKLQSHVSREKKLSNDNKRRTNSETTGNPSGEA